MDRESKWSQWGAKWGGEEMECTVCLSEGF
jgi:hypothetical protein